MFQLRIYCARQGRLHSFLIYSSFCVILLAAGEAYGRQFVRMENPQLGFGLKYEYEKEERKGPFISTEESIRTYTERLDIHTKGWIYHPGLAVYQLTYSPEWEQVRSDRGTNIAESTSFLHGYTADVKILQYKPYSLNLFGQQRRTTVNSNFAQRSKNESTSYGASLSLRNQIVPAALTYVHAEDEQTGLFETSFDRDEVRFNATFVKLGRTVLRASYIDSRQNTQNTIIDSEQETISLSNSLSPGGNRDVRISSSFNMTEVDSTNQHTRRENITERLTWTHNENLSTQYALTYDKEERFDKSTSTEAPRELSSGEFSLNHFLYENLSTNLFAAAYKNNFEDDEEITYKLSGKFKYKRRIPGGMLFVDVSQRLEMIDEDITPNISQVSDEPVLLKTGEISFLDEENVDAGSIIVTDNTGLITYSPGSDYTISQVGTLTRISCVTGGLIDQPGNLCATGVSVLVSYQYDQETSFDYYTHSHSYGVNLLFKEALSLSYQVFFLNQYYLSGVRPDILSDEISRLGGAELDFGWSKTTLQFENNSSRSNPIKATRIAETFTVTPYKNIYTFLTIQYTETKFKDTGEHESFNGIRAKVQALLSRRSQLIITGFRDRESGDDKLTEDLGFTALYTKLWRIYKIDIDYTFSVQKDKKAGERIKNHYLLFTIKRELF